MCKCTCAISDLPVTTRLPETRNGSPVPYGKYWSLVANEGQILALDERGDLLLINANPKSFYLIDSLINPPGDIWQ